MRMKSLKKINWLFILLLVGFMVIYLSNLLIIPFHPDESTQLYMSTDFIALLSDPISIVFNPNAPNTDPKIQYRLLDAPLTRYLLGLGLYLAHLSPPSKDWNWSKSWEENNEAGALPDQKTLLIGRCTISSLILLSLTFIYLIGKRLNGQITGYLALIFLGTNSLMLLHNRRAMAEGPLTACEIFAFWTFIQANKYPWLAGISTALAFNAKQSAIALIPIGLLSATWGLFDRQKIYKLIINLLLYIATFSLITFLLNPFLWKSPLSATEASLKARKELLASQINDIGRFEPQQVLHQPSQRLLSLIANLYLLPPATAEVGNYMEQTSEAEAEYFSKVFYRLFRNPFFGGILLALTLLGFARSLFHLRQLEYRSRKCLILLLLATVSEAAVILLMIPLPWQRYVMPLVPFTTLWMSLGVSPILEEIVQRIKNKRQPR
jgi:hypothetical protein